MNVHIEKSDVAGTVKVPTSKSYTIRALLCAAVARGRSVIVEPLESDDTSAALDCLASLGTDVKRLDGSVEIVGGSLHPLSSGHLWCNESAATMRFLMALVATVPGTTVLRCAPSLARRPMAQLSDVLGQFGARCEIEPVSGTVTIRGTTPTAADIVMRGDISSQYVSALLLSGPLFPQGLTVRLETPLVSKQYVAMTLDCMASFGVTVDVREEGRVYHVPSGDYKPSVYTVEGDWSAAAALLALGAAAGSVTVSGLNVESLQADVLMLELLERMGACVRLSGDIVEVKHASISSFEADISEAIDLLPVAMALAAMAEGSTSIRGIARARDKESDRVAAMTEGLRNMGVDVDVTPHFIVVKGGAGRGAVVSSYGDHRIAMAFGVLGAAVGDTTILDAECVGKTYPAFWKDIERLGVRVDYE
ncbi:MAG TPA: 3-phosphoshikimate 1-carboxyvinyltransferase [Dehalococcoidia bacterium]|nr:3-phosphoshikimate 1-carboxyvinyltransferase [Dehalococcoidia bacterium]